MFSTGVCQESRWHHLNGRHASNGGSGLTKSGAGRLTLAQSNSFTGLIDLQGGVLEIGNGGSAGTLGTGSISNNASLIINRSGKLTYGGIISGTGTVQIAGPGIFVLTNNSTYSGTTSISNGTLQIGAGGSSGSVGGGALSVLSALTYLRSDNQTGVSAVTNVISGSGIIAIGAAASSRSIEFNGNVGQFAGTIVVSNMVRMIDLVGTPGLTSVNMVVRNGGQVFVGAGSASASSLTLSGNGWLEPGGPYGSLRMDGATYGGTINLATDSSISPVYGIGTVSGSITGAFELALISGSAISDRNECIRVDSNFENWNRFHCGLRGKPRRIKHGCLAGGLWNHSAT